MADASPGMKGEGDERTGTLHRRRAGSGWQRASSVLGGSDGEGLEAASHFRASRVASSSQRRAVSGATLLRRGRADGRTALSRAGRSHPGGVEDGEKGISAPRSSRGCPLSAARVDGRDAVRALVELLDVLHPNWRGSVGGSVPGGGTTGRRSLFRRSRCASARPSCCLGMAGGRLLPEGRLRRTDGGGSRSRAETAHSGTLRMSGATQGGLHPWLLRAAAGVGLHEGGGARARSGSSTLLLRFRGSSGGLATGGRTGRDFR